VKAKPLEKIQKTTNPSTRGHWNEMNRKHRREMMRKIQSEDISLEVVHPDAAGIDIGNESHYVAAAPSRDKQPVRSFGCTTGELKAMADWLKQCGIRTVAMQSTGVYWIAVYDILEQAGLEVYLVIARETKNLRGRKSDVQESQWLMKLRNSFRPSQEIRTIAAVEGAVKSVGNTGSQITKIHDALARNWSCGYTLGMKTAISIPNDLFDGAERLARRMRRSRSRLFTDALREYLARHAPDKVTESMDQAIMEVGEGKDEFVSSAARHRLERTEW
jgi:metal-responsive CopG/Arc/MetJ family transcriptional regulator